MSNNVNKSKKTADVTEIIRNQGPVTEATDRMADRPLLKNNFVLMALSGVMIVLGFALMAGGGSGVDQYNPEIFSTRRIVVGPLICFLGYVLMAVAIMIKPKNK